MTDEEIEDRVSGLLFVMEHQHGRMHKLRQLAAPAVIQQHEEARCQDVRRETTDEIRRLARRLGRCPVDLVESCRDLRWDVVADIYDGEPESDRKRAYQDQKRTLSRGRRLALRALRESVVDRLGELVDPADASPG